MYVHSYVHVYICTHCSVCYVHVHCLLAVSSLTSSSRSLWVGGDRSSLCGTLLPTSDPQRPSPQHWVGGLGLWDEGRLQVGLQWVGISTHSLSALCDQSHFSSTCRVIYCIASFFTALNFRKDHWFCIICSWFNFHAATHTVKIGLGFIHVYMYLRMYVCTCTYTCRAGMCMPVLCLDTDRPLWMSAVRRTILCDRLQATHTCVRVA